MTSHLRTIAIFGAGPALGLSTGLRFARAGYRVYLVARNAKTLGRLNETLEQAGAEVHYLVADLTDTQAVRAAIDVIEATVGSPDVVLYSPGDVSRLPVAAGELDSTTLLSWLPLNLLAPVELAHAALPAMLARGSGTLLFTQGTAVRNPAPAFASSSVAQAALLNYIEALSVSYSTQGVRAVSVQIGQLIEGSAAAHLFDGGTFAEIEPNALPRIHPDLIAEQLWDLSHDSNAPTEYYI